MIYHRIKIEGKHLKKSDQILGLGVDSDLMNRIRKIKKERGEKVDYSDRYDNRTGYAIDGTKFNTRYHPIFDKKLYDTKKDRTLHIDGYFRYHYFGWHWMLLYKDDNNSHGQLIWEIETCLHPEWIKDAKENKKRYKLI